jgi:hypothetical protein
MNSVPVWIVNTFTNSQDANKAKMAAVFSPTIQSTLKSTRDDMMNAGTALIKALSSQESSSADERKNIEQQLRSVEAKMSKLVSQSQNLDISLTNAITTNLVKNKMNIKQKQQHAKPVANGIAATTMTPTSNTKASNANAKETFLGTSSLIAQEKDTRIQFESNYTFYTVWLIIGIVLFVIMFSNFFYTSSESSSVAVDGSESDSSSYVLLFGIIALLFFIYFIVQYALARYNISRQQLPFESVNPLFVL